ncbi:MAG: hypothetical protein GX063_03665 [Firmicutes bacterium]|nr:hypothetical protein [Bacillota bacterium]
MPWKKIMHAQNWYWFLLLSLAGLWCLSGCLWQVEAAAGKAAESLAEKVDLAANPRDLNCPDGLLGPLEPAQGLSLHGMKVLELQYVSITGDPRDPAAGPLPGLTLSQRLEAQVEYLWPGIWVRGRFYDDPFFPQYMLQVDTANASIKLGEVETKLLSPPLSPVSLSLTGVQGALAWRDAAFFLAAGHPQAVLKTETFILHPAVRVYQTAKAPLVPNTEIVQVEGRRLKAGVDYLIDYNTGIIRLLGLWPEAAKLTVTYQAIDSTPGKKPLVQGFRTEYDANSGRFGFTHLSRRETDTDLSSGAFSSWSGDYEAPYTAYQTWSALSFETPPKGPGPRWAAEIWRRASQPLASEDRTVEDMETHTLRRPLFAGLSDPQSWSQPRGTGGSSLELGSVTGWLPLEGITRSALQLDFVLEGGGAWVETRLAAPSPVILEGETDLILTLGLPRPLSGMRLEIRLLSGASGFFWQSIPLGNLVGWQDVLLSGSQWEKNGLPAWEKITGVELRLTSLLPGTASGQITLSALDIGTASRAASRWRPLPYQEASVELEDLPLSAAPWSPPPSNTALAVKVKSNSFDTRLPQILGYLPRPFSPADAEYLTFWAHTPLSGTELTIWLLDYGRNAAGPVSIKLSPGWDKYRLDLSKPAVQLRGREIAGIALAVTPPPGSDSVTIILDEWQLEGSKSLEGYMGRFAVSQDSGTIRWRFTGNSQTKGFHWDVPGQTSDIPHPHYLGLEAEIQRPGNKHTAISIQQLGMGDGETSLELKTDAWEGTVLEGQLSIPNGSPSSQPALGGGVPTGHLRLESRLNTGSFEVTAWQKAGPALISEPSASPTRRGLSLKAEKELPPGLLQIGGWQLAEGPSGQNIAGDFSFQLAGALPISTAFWLLRYQEAPNVPAEIGGLGRLEAGYQSPGGAFHITGRWEEMVGREKQSFLGLESYGAENPLAAPWNLETGFSWDGTANPRLWQQRRALGWQWLFAEKAALGAHWNQETATNLEASQSSLTDSGSLSLSLPVSSRWLSRGAVNWSRSSDANGSLSTVEYSLASEGAWLEDWTGGLVLSQRQTRMQQLDLSPGEHGTAEGERWLLRADAQYAYRPQGSVGLGMTLVRQNGAGSSTGSLGPSSRYPESSRAGSLEPLVSQAYSWLDDTDYMTFSGYGEFHDLPAVGEGAGTYMDGQIRWMLADDAVYRVDLGACTYIPVSSGPSSTTCYTRAAWEKNWGALGTSRFHVSAGAGSRPVLSVGLGWTKPAAFGETGLFWQASIRHVRQEDYHFTGTRLGIEYRF